MIAPQFDLQSIAEISAGRALNGLLSGLVVTLAAWVVARLAARQGSGTRFAVWMIALAAVILFLFAGPSAAPEAGSAAVSHTALLVPASWATALFVAWSVIAGLGLLRVAIGLWRLRHLRNGCLPVDRDTLDPRLQATLDQHSGLRHVTLCCSDDLRVPSAIGYFRPIVAMPAWTLAELPPEELNAILLHELAHLRRWDDWTNLIQKIVKAVLFFHPAVWWIESHLSLEREMACDDAVLANSLSPKAYAESLVCLAEKSFLRRGVQLAQAAVSHVHQLRMRVQRILAQGPQGSTRVGKPAVAVMTLAALMGWYGAARLPQLLAFAGDNPDGGLASLKAPASLEPPALITPGFVPKSQSIAFDRGTRHSRNQAAGFVAVDYPRERPVIVPVSFVVVMQPADFDPAGGVVWRVAVYRLTEFRSSVHPGLSGMIPRKT